MDKQAYLAYAKKLEAALQAKGDYYYLPVEFKQAFLAGLSIEEAVPEMIKIQDKQKEESRKEMAASIARLAPALAKAGVSLRPLMGSRQHEQNPH